MVDGRPSNAELPEDGPVRSRRPPFVTVHLNVLRSTLQVYIRGIIPSGASRRRPVTRRPKAGAVPRTGGPDVVPTSSRPRDTYVRIPLHRPSSFPEGDGPSRIRATAATASTARLTLGVPWLCVPPSREVCLFDCYCYGGALTCRVPSQVERQTGSGAQTHHTRDGIRTPGLDTSRLS
jgi:hypothetical protein